MIMKHYIILLTMISIYKYKTDTIAYFVYNKLLYSALLPTHTIQGYVIPIMINVSIRFL